MIETRITITLFALSVLVGILVSGLIGSAQVLAQTYATSTATTTTATSTSSTTTPSTTATTTPTTGTSTPITVLCEINRTLTVGSVGEDVRCLQRYLNSAGFTLAFTGPGSLGNETAYFGNLTKQAVIRWQEVNASTVLVPLGLSSGTGVWGRYSMNQYTSMVRFALGLPGMTVLSLAR